MSPAAAPDPDLLVIRRGFRFLRDADSELFTEQARGLAFALESFAGRTAEAPRQAEARGLAAELFALYPFETAT